MARTFLPGSGAATRFLLLVLLLGATPGRALPKDEAPRNPGEAIARARLLLDAAIKTPPVADNDTKAFKDNAEMLRGAMALLKGQEKEGLKLDEFKGIWNEAVSLYHFHGAAPAPDYRLEKERVPGIPVRFGFPTGRGWAFDTKDQDGNAQIGGTVRKTLPGGRVVREIKIWIHDWNTVHFNGTGDVGVSGENAREIAERDMAADREKMDKVEFRSNRIVTARVGRGFPKSSYYEIVGVARNAGPVRRRNYFVKGVSTTYNFEVIEMRKTAPGDDAWTVWQASHPDPELDAILESFEDAAGK